MHSVRFALYFEVLETIIKMNEEFLPFVLTADMEKVVINVTKLAKLIIKNPSTAIKFYQVRNMFVI